MSQNSSSAAVVIVTLRVKVHSEQIYELCFFNLKIKYTGLSSMGAHKILVFIATASSHGSEELEHPCSLYQSLRYWHTQGMDIKETRV